MACGHALFDGTLEVTSLISTPDHPSLDISGDIDIRALVALDTWVSLAILTFIAKWKNSNPAEGCYRFTKVPDGRLQFIWQDIAGFGTDLISDTAVTAISGQHLWVRTTFDADNGSSDSVARFYTSGDPIETDPALVAWTQLGSDVIAGFGPAVIQTNDRMVELGSFNEEISDQCWAGKFWYGEIRNGINGTIVAAPDFRCPGQKTGDAPTEFTDSTGKVWTFDRAVWVEGDCCGELANNQIGGTGAIRKPPRAFG